MKIKPDPRKVFTAKTSFLNNYGPRHLRRSVARANLERLGVTNLNSKNRGKNLGFSKFSANWRKAAFVPSNEDIFISKKQHEQDAKKRRKAREKASA
jgi:hypothetical protein